MIRGYYFQQQLADVIKQEIKHNFCSVKVELDFALFDYKGKGKGAQETAKTPDKVDKVEVIIVCRNTRDVLGERGARIRLLQHKVDGFFGFPPGFLEIFCERKEREYDSDDSDDCGKGKKGKKGKDWGKKGYSPDAEEPPVRKEAKPPKRKPPPEPRREIPEDFDSEQWMACAVRCARLTHTLKKKDTFAPVEMLLRDPVLYAVRLWREHNLRASPPPIKDKKPEPVSLPQGGLVDWGVPADDWGVPDFGSWDSPNDPWTDSVHTSAANVPTGALSEAEKLAARAKRFGASSQAAKADRLVIQDFGSDEDVHLENLDLRTASCEDVIEQLRKVRTFAKGVRIGLVLLPSGRELEPDFQMSKIPAGETVKFMALASGW